MLSKHKFNTLAAKFLNPDIQSSKQQWDIIKKETGQIKHHPPNRILDRGYIITSPKAIANVMNQDYKQIIKDTIKDIPISIIDPIENYKKAIGEVDHKLTFRQISMHELRTILNKLKPTGSTSYDHI